MTRHSPDLSDYATLSPDLPDELVHEILFRLPPDEPACLVRLSVLSKPWRRLLSDPAFHHHYHKFHQTPPMLGFLHNHVDALSVAHFVPNTESCLPCTLDPQLADLAVCDCRHGRVLLASGSMSMKLMVWDPMMGRRRELRFPPDSLFYVGTAVLCAVDGCDHATCHDGPFHVVFLGGHVEEGVTAAYLYSSDTGEWSMPTSELDLIDLADGSLGGLDLIDGSYYVQSMHSVLVGETLHFLMRWRQGARVLKYNMGRHCLSVINPPAAAAVHGWANILMALEDDRLGIAHLDKLMLHLWSREVGPDGVAAWMQHRAIDLRPFLPVGEPTIKAVLIGSMEGANIIFTTTTVGVYAIDLKSLQSRKLCERQNIQSLFPFTSFYYPPEQ